MKKNLVKGALLLSMVTIGFSPALTTQAKTTPKLTQKKVTINVGQKKKLKIKGTGKKVKWTSNKKKIVTVSPKGVLKGKKAGKAIVTAKVGNRKFKCKVTVNKGNPSLNAKSITLKKGGSYKLKVKNGTGVKWSSNNKGVATVSSKGVVKAKKTGKATITAKVGKKKLTCKVTVKKGNNKSDKDNGGKINISKEVKKQLPYIGDGWEARLDISIEDECVPLNGMVDLFNYLENNNSPIKVTSNLVKTKYYKWFSSDESIISINKFGVATAHKEGKVKVYFKFLAKNGKWCTSRVSTIEAKDIGDVAFSYQFGHNSEWVNDDCYTINRLGPIDNSAVNYVNVTVTNNSTVPIKMRHIGVYCYSTWIFKPEGTFNGIVNPGETKTFMFSYPTILIRPQEIYKLYFTYDYKNTWGSVYHNITNNYWGFYF